MPDYSLYTVLAQNLEGRIFHDCHNFDQHFHNYTV